MMIDRGAEFLSSPVFGPPQRANSGTLIFATAGATSSIEKMRTSIKGVMGRDKISFGDEPHSNAAKFRLIGNTFALNTITQIAESLTLAEKSSISPATVNKFADIMYGGIYSVYAGRMLSGEYWTRSEPYASADIAIKDINHLLGLGQEANRELKNAQTGLAYLKMAIEKSPGNQVDVSAIYGAVRKANGLEFENTP
ncbi:6-phosphogluconate dehydrogenase [Fusarium agapanthi]|uniref:6-phosphogluconate dehydrogenase n=1 Tax=Fusarium agapanthi TaxID=1803897 RepID=A0A9P5EGC6_9HYPO|nr:6-phosphogluconate dehydrogenase [Fusarium agapanthi]